MFSGPAQALIIMVDIANFVIVVQRALSNFKICVCFFLSLSIALLSLSDSLSLSHSHIFFLSPSLSFFCKFLSYQMNIKVL